MPLYTWSVTEGLRSDGEPLPGTRDPLIALDEIIKEPASGKQLHGELAAFRSFRIGKIRIIYREKPDILEIIAIGRREVIYYETTLLLKRQSNK